MNKKRHIAFVFFIWLTQVFLVRAQDPQLSQMYAAPLLISPAFAGIDNQSNVRFAHRNQWPSLNANYQFSAISANIALGNQKSGLGVLITSDKQFLNLQTTQLGLQYGHHIDLGEDMVVGRYPNRPIHAQFGCFPICVCRSISFNQLWLYAIIL